MTPADASPDFIRALAGKCRIERTIGEGGMATVYLADDLRHERKVAIKVLKPELAAALGAERFLAEIKTTANLTHPHILALFDSGEAEGSLYYVMPYVEGESLRVRLNREKQLPVDEAVKIAKAVAGALDYAHRQGVIHRDIKPGNILFQDGEPVVADFGIALAVGAAGGSRLTETGLSLGTPHYMSPEQATGDGAVGATSDVWALGCVLYETLVGEPPYAAPTAQAVLGRILKGDPVSAASGRKAVPPNVEGAIRKALERIPADRFEDARAFAQALNDPGFRYGEVVGAGAGPGAWRAAALGLAALAAFLLLTALPDWLTSPTSSDSATVYRLAIPLPEGQRLSTFGVDWGSHVLDISPDGSLLAYVAQSGGQPQLFVRPLDVDDPRPLAGTERAHQPFFSPDGDWIGYFVDRTLYRVPVAGGPPIPVSDGPASGPTYGGAWGTDGTILFFVDGHGLVRISEDGGEAGTVPVEDGRPARWPQFLGDDRVLIATSGGVGVLDLTSGEVRVVHLGDQARYSNGHLVYRERDGIVRVAPWDPGSQGAAAPPLPVILEVFQGGGAGAAQFAVSRNGVLVYVGGGSERSLVLADRNGREWPVDVGNRPYRLPTFSPDGARIAVNVDPVPNPVWLVDLGSSTALPITNDAAVHHFRPIWAPDGERIAVSPDGNAAWFGWREGSELHRVTEGPRLKYVWSWSRNEELLLTEDRRDAADRGSGPEGPVNRDLVVFDMAEGTTRDLYATPADERSPMLSPDGRWVAFSSNVSGRYEVYVLPFSGPGTPELVSSGGGTEPVWADDGSELFYRSGDRIMAVDVETSAGFQASEPALLFSGPYDFTQFNNWDVAPDGRFIMVKGPSDLGRQFRVVLNWLARLQAEGSS